VLTPGAPTFASRRFDPRGMGSPRLIWREPAAALPGAGNWTLEHWAKIAFENPPGLFFSGPCRRGTTPMPPCALADLVRHGYDYGAPRAYSQTRRAQGRRNTAVSRHPAGPQASAETGGGSATLVEIEPCKGVARTRKVAAGTAAFRGVACGSLGGCGSGGRDTGLRAAAGGGGGATFMIRAARWKPRQSAGTGDPPHAWRHRRGRRRRPLLAFSVDSSSKLRPRRPCVDAEAAGRSGNPYAVRLPPTPVFSRTRCSRNCEQLRAALPNEIRDVLGATIVWKS